MSYRYGLSIDVNIDLSDYNNDESFFDNLHAVKEKVCEEMVEYIDSSNHIIFDKNTKTARATFYNNDRVSLDGDSLKDICDQIVDIIGVEYVTGVSGRADGEDFGDITVAVMHPVTKEIIESQAVITVTFPGLEGEIDMDLIPVVHT